MLIAFVTDPLDSDDDCKTLTPKQCLECNAIFKSHFDLFHHQIEECKRSREISITKVTPSLAPLRPSKLKPAYTVVDESEARTCMECKQTFPTRRALNQHKRFDCGPNKRQQSRPKVYRCACGTVFTKSSNLLRHKKAGTCAKVMQKTGYTSKMFYCVECKIEYSSLHNLRRHKKSCPFGSNLKDWPVIKPRRVMCERCGMTFSHNSNLSRHRRDVKCIERIKRPVNKIDDDSEDSPNE